ncbi:MAG: hypothetical protein OEV78_08665 [Spirochaetia bacterium]|nr:hypothetical protein [Spirochaetia bacterium]
MGFDIPKKILQSVSYRIGATLTEYHQQELTSAENIKLLLSKPERVDVEYFPCGFFPCRSRACWEVAQLNLPLNIFLRQGLNKQVVIGDRIMPNP